MSNSTAKALFLDRDGVINVEKNYVYRIEDFDFITGIFDLCACAVDRGFVIIVITNQAGIARGYYSVRDFEKLTDWMLHQFSDQGVHIHHVYYCPYHPIAGVGTYKRDSFDRKPKPGMILKAKDEFDLDLTNSVLVGDKASDIQAGITAGVGNNILLIPDTENKASAGYRHCKSIPDITNWLASHFPVCD
jgi:D-glycero-D-manno-heptose 1,7-bisphosphate phosphatase